jgi:hypothetical protein
MKVWPFMFAASRTMDYQFVALPEIFDLNSCGALRDRLELSEADPVAIKTASLSTRQNRTLSCIYRSGPILMDDVLHTDSAGRKLLFAFGLVVEVLPETIDQLTSVIDATQPLFERGLVSFLNSNATWTPIVTRAFELPIDQPTDVPSGFLKINGPAAVLSLVLLLSLGMCGRLYFENRSLHSQLIEMQRHSSMPSVVDGEPTQNLEPAPSAAPRIPKNELETKGPLTIEQPRQ